MYVANDHEPDPGRELRRAATRLDWCLGAISAQRTGEAIEQGFLEAPKHAWMLSNLAARHAGGVCELARASRVYLPGAWVLARAAMESSLRLAWLAEPADIWDREARWVVLMDEGVRYHERVAGDLGSDDSTPFKAVAEAQRPFVSRVRDALPSHVTMPPGVPSMESVASKVGDEFYALYRTASQYTHGTDAAAWLYRRNLGVDAIYGEFITDRMWVPVINLAWQSARFGALTVMALTGVTVTIHLAALDKSMRDALEALAVVQTPKGSTT